MKEDIVDFFLNHEEFPFNLQMVGQSFCDGSYHVERTNPDIYVFEYILEGEGTVIVGDEIYHPSKGDVYMLQRGKDHRYYSDGERPWKKIWVNIYGSLVDSLMQAYGLTRVYYISNLDLSKFLNQMIDLTRDKELEMKELFQKEALLFHEMIIRISNHVQKTSSENPTPAQVLKQFLDQNAEKHLGMKELGNIIYKSPSQTVRIFKKEFNMTPYEYLQQQKIEMAKLLLSNFGVSVKEIAYRLNFADEHYFSNCFKAKTGMSPTEYRRGLQNKGLV